MLARMASLLGTMVLVCLPVGCAANAGADDASSASEDALTGVKVGRYAIDDAPSSGSYIESLTISANKKVELEYVRVREGSSPWVFNPWIPVPTRDEEKLALTGTYATFAGDPGETLISFDVSDQGIDHLIYSFKMSGGAMILEAVGASPFTLKPSSAAPAATDARVLTCQGRVYDAVITLDQAQRRRGTMKITRKAGADRMDPPTGSFTVAYTGDTGVDDYMGYEGTDSKNNSYDFALKKSDLAKTSGKIATVGVNFDLEFSPGGIHTTLDCTIKRP